MSNEAKECGRCGSGFRGNQCPACNKQNFKKKKAWDGVAKHKEVRQFMQEEIAGMRNTGERAFRPNKGWQIES